MKKTKLILCSLFLLPIMLIAGCGSPKQYSITTLSSNALLGSASGGSTSTFVEGTDIKLVATPKTGVEFLCWIKDFQKVTSLESTTTVKVGADTAGNYTALFAEESHRSMIYIGLSEISYEGDGDYSKIDYTVRYAPSNNTEAYAVLEQGSSETNTIDAFSGAVFRIFENSNYISYIFDVTLTITNRAGTSAITLPFTNAGNDMLIENAQFAEYGTASITKNGLTLKFSKMNKEMLEKLNNAN